MVTEVFLFSFFCFVIESANVFALLFCFSIYFKYVLNVAL